MRGDDTTPGSDGPERDSAREARRAERARKSARRGRTGNVVLGLLIAGGLVGIWYGQELGWANLLRDVFQVEEEEPEVYKPPTDNLVEGQTVDPTPWLSDPRWDEAIESGEAGRTRLLEAVDRHFNVEGDPFRLRSETAKANDELGKAVRLLEEMEAEYEGDTVALLEIRKKLNRYRQVLNDQGPKQR